MGGRKNEYTHTEFKQRIHAHMRVLPPRAEARHMEATLMAAVAESMSVSVASQEQLQPQHYQQEPEAKPNSQPKKLNAASTYIMEIAEDDVNANYPPRAHRDGTTDTTASQPALQLSCTCMRNASDAAIVLRVRSNSCKASKGLCTLSAQHQALPPPPTLVTSATPTATGTTFRPETLPTNQSTCCTVCCSLIAFGMAREDEPEEKKHLEDYQRCWPPPLFIVLVSLLEVSS